MDSMLSRLFCSKNWFYDNGRSGSNTSNYRGEFSCFRIMAYWGSNDCDKTIKDHNASKTDMDDYSYVTDPGVEKDPKKWLTKIIYYINEK